MTTPFSPPLNLQRRGRIISILRGFGGVSSVLDVGCGQGDLLNVLCNGGYNFLAGVDVDSDAISSASYALKPRESEEKRDEPLKVALYRTSFEDLSVEKGTIDAVISCECIEHLDPAPLAALGPTVLGKWQPRLFIITTPNCEVNPLLGMKPGELRIADHRFEWTREEFAAYCAPLAATFGYNLAYTGVGRLPGSENVGPATQFAVFWRPGPSNRSRPTISNPAFISYDFPTLPLPSPEADSHAMIAIETRIRELSEIPDTCRSCPYFQTTCLPLTFNDLWSSRAIRIACRTANSLVDIVNRGGKGRVVAQVDLRPVGDPWERQGLKAGEMVGEDVNVHCNRKWARGGR